MINLSYSLLEALRELDEDAWSATASEIYPPNYFQIIKEIADKTRNGKNYIEYIKQNYDSKYVDPRSFVSKAAFNNLEDINNMLADCYQNALPNKKYEDTFNDKFTIIKTNSKSELKHYGEGSWCCVCGRVRANSQSVRNGEANAGDFIPGRSEYFLKHYYKEKNYSYYWYIVIDNDTNEKYYIGIDRTDGHVVEFRNKYDREVTVNQLPELNELKDYITNDFNKFKTSPKYKEIILEATRPFDPNYELDSSDRYYADDSEYFSHTTETFSALVGILNKLDTRDLNNIKQNDFNLNVGRNGTVSITNQFIVDSTGKRLFPGPILRNPDKFKFGIVFSKDSLKNIDLEDYHDFLNYWNNFDTNFDPTNQPNVKGYSYLRINWIARTKDKAYLKIYMWPGILEISVDSYNKIKNYLRMQSESSLSSKKLNGWDWKPNSLALGMESVLRGGKLKPSDFIEGCSYGNSAGPAITNLPVHKWQALDRNEYKFNEVYQELDKFKNSLDRNSKNYNKIITELNLNKNVLYKVDLKNLYKQIINLNKNNYFEDLTTEQKNEILNIANKAHELSANLALTQRNRTNKLNTEYGKNNKFRMFHVYLDANQTKEIFDNFQVSEKEKRAKSGINFNDNSVVELCLPDYYTLLDKQEATKYNLNLLDIIKNKKFTKSDNFNKLLNLLYEYLDKNTNIDVTFYDSKTLQSLSDIERKKYINIINNKNKKEKQKNDYKSDGTVYQIKLDNSSFKVRLYPGVNTNYTDVVNFVKYLVDNNQMKDGDKLTIGPKSMKINNKNMSYKYYKFDRFKKAEDKNPTKLRKLPKDKKPVNPKVNNKDKTPYRIENDYAVFTIKGTKGKEDIDFLVDLEDVEKVSQHRWTAQPYHSILTNRDGYTIHYTYTEDGKTKTMSLARYLGYGRGYKPRNDNWFDFRKENIIPGEKEWLLKNKAY